MIRHKFRDLLNRYMPVIGHAVRGRRRIRRAQESPVRTAHGFVLAGNARMAASDFEPDEVAAFVQALQECDACIDVGANVGFYSCLAATRGVPVVAIEPHPANQQLLCRNLQLNALEHTVEVFPMGLSDRPGLLPLFGDDTGASFVQNWSGNVSTRPHVVPVNTLDAIIGGRFEGKRLLIKIDVEGFESMVLKGARMTLERIPRPIWLLEICLTEHFPAGINKHFEETFDVFWSRAYQARTCNRQGAEVGRADVSRWRTEMRTDSGSYSYLFTDTRT